MNDDLSDMPLAEAASKYLYPIFWNSDKIKFYESITGKSHFQDREGKIGRTTNSIKLKNFFEDYWVMSFKNKNNFFHITLC